MEVSLDQEDEIRAILSAHPIGISFSTMYKKAKLFSSESSLASFLHTARQQGWVYTKQGLHFLVKTVEDTSINPASTQEKVEVEVETQPSSATPTFIKNPFQTSIGSSASQRLPFGSLLRSKTLGPVALSLYKWRAEDALSLDELVDITGCKKTVLYNLMTKLVDEGYVDKNQENIRRPYFRWSGKFCYPFTKMLETDTDLLKFKTVAAYKEYKEGASGIPTLAPSSPASEEQKASDSLTGPIVPNSAVPILTPTFRPKDETPSTSTNTTIKRAVDFINGEIDLCKRHIDTLVKLRSLLEGTT